MKNPDPSEKALLTPVEAIKHYHLQYGKFYAFIKQKHSFITCYGSRKLIIRVELEKFFQENPEIKEKLNGSKV